MKRVLKVQRVTAYELSAVRKKVESSEFFTSLFKSGKVVGISSEFRQHGRKPVIAVTILRNLDPQVKDQIKETIRQHLEQDLQKRAKYVGIVFDIAGAIVFAKEEEQPEMCS